MPLMHFERNDRRALPWRPFSSACFEHSSDAALRGFSAGFVACASAAPAQTKLATAAIIRVRMGVVLLLNWAKAKSGALPRRH